MKIGLVGFPGSGKTTVFNALTGLSAETGYAASRGKTHLGVVKVPDPRVEALAGLFQPKKKTLAEITFSDVAAEAGGAGSARGLDRTVLAAMREMESLCQVARAFVDPAQGAGQRSHVLVACDVRHNRGAADFVRERLDRALSASYANDMKALCRKRSRSRFADAGAGAGDHSDTSSGCWCRHLPNFSWRAKFSVCTGLVRLQSPRGTVVVAHFAAPD